MIAAALKYWYIIFGIMVIGAAYFFGYRAGVKSYEAPPVVVDTITKVDTVYVEKIVERTLYPAPQILRDTILVEVPTGWKPSGYISARPLGFDRKRHVAKLTYWSPAMGGYVTDTYRLPRARQGLSTALGYGYGLDVGHVAIVRQTWTYRRLALFHEHRFNRTEYSGALGVLIRLH